MFKFVETRADSFDRKRKYTACDSCRRKKKRCKHGSETDQLLPQESPSSDNTILDPALVPSSELQIPNTQTESTSVQIQENAHQSTHLQPKSPRENPTSRSIEPNFEIRDGSHHRSTMSGNGQTVDSRFIGNMNPEGLFLAATSPEDL